MKVLLVAAAMGLTGCIFPRAQVLYIGDLTPPQQELCLQGAADWNGRTDGMHDLILTRDASQTTRKIVTDPNPGRLIGREDVDGVYRRSIGWVFIKEGLTYERFASVCKHELGHAMAGQDNPAHADDPKAVMYYKSGTNVAITESDMEWCRKNGACD